MSNYDENQIQILEGLEAVRKRPGMYIGTTSLKGLHHLVYEIVDNSVDEGLAGFCNSINVVIHKNGAISVKDNGRGIPIGIHPKKGVSAVEVVFTTLHAGGKFGGGGYSVSGGLHGVGASVVNALSETLTVQIFKDNKIHKQIYKRGKVDKKLEIVGDTDESGTLITFKPDSEIFEEIDFKFDILKERFQEIAFLTKGLKITLKDERDDKEVSFYYEGGIKEFVKHLNRNKTPIYNDIFYCSAIKDKIQVEISFQHTDGYLENIYTFVNNINTTEGGTHLAGFRNGLTKILNDYAKKNNLIKEADRKLAGEDFREGITAIVSIKIEDPQFEGQTKAKLGSTIARPAVDNTITEYLKYFLEENPTIGKILIEKALTSSRARDAAKKARELVRRKSILESGRLPGKLSDCLEKNPDLCEIYIVEGDSAGGSAKSARTSKTQAILPLRGKILNVEKSRLDKILGNEEIKAMITAFGTGIDEDFNIEKLRYAKIILMTDADVDGSHIRTLLLTFIYRYMRQLIENGNIYIAQPPLYKVEKKRKEYYAYSDEELENILNKIGKDDIKPIQRYKGLGEMDAEQLWDTTMNPEKRVLLQVKLDDVIKADDIFNRLMGDKVEPRRNFINENAKYVKNLDV